MSSTQDDRERLLADAFVGLADSLVAQLGNAPMHVAFDHLRRYARSHNVLLGEAARGVVADRGFAREVFGVRVT